MDKLSQNLAPDKALNESETPDLQDTLKATLDSIHFLSKKMGSEAMDMRVLQQLILDVTKTPEDILDSMDKFYQRDHLLTELKALDAGQKTEIDQIFSQAHRSLKDEDYRQALEKGAAALSQPCTVESPYRKKNQETIDQTIGRFNEYREKGYPYDTQEALSDFIEKEYLTWLDIALLQEGTRLKMGRACNLDQTRKKAQKLFGEQSRVERQLARFKSLPPINGKDICRLATPVVMAPVAATIYTIVDILQRRDLSDFDKTGFSLTLSLFILIYMFFPGYIVKEGFFNAEKEGPTNKTRKYISKKYFKMVVPTEVRSFVSLMTEVYEGMDKLQGLSNPEDRLDILEKLNKLAAQAQKIIIENKELFEEKPLSAKGDQRELLLDDVLSAARPTRVRVEEVVDAVLEEEAAELDEPEENEVEAAGTNLQKLPNRV